MENGKTREMKPTLLFEGNRSATNDADKQVVSVSEDYLFTPARVVGEIRAASPSMFEFVLGSAECSEPSHTLCSVGDYIIVRCGSVGVFGKIGGIVTEQRMVRDSDAQGHKDRESCEYLVAVVSPSVSIVTSNGKVHPGVIETPKVGALVYAVTPEIVEYVLNPHAGSRSDGTDLHLSFAKFVTVGAGDLKVTPEMMFGRHCAVLGTTGGGKSWTIASMLEEAKMHNSKIILLDPSGEYSKLKGGVRSVYLGNHPHPGEHESPVALPYYDLKETDLFAIFKPAGETQAPKLLSAMKTLKLARLDPSLALDGVVFKANKSKKQYETAYNRYFDKVEGHYADFDIKKLARQINHECVFPTRSDLEPFVWGDYNGSEQARVIPLINRIQQIITSKELAPIFQPEDRRSLIDEIESFIQSTSDRILRISLQYLSFSFYAREIVANTVGRLLLEQARESRFMQKPLLIVVDEGHHFLNRNLVEGDLDYPLDAFAVIAKEGRKYGLTICIATQRPRDIPEGVLSQIGTFIVHRVINDFDQQVIERASSQADKTVVLMLPILGPGEAVILGVDFPVPLHVRIQPPKYKPISHGPDFQRCWK